MRRFAEFCEHLIETLAFGFALGAGFAVGWHVFYLITSSLIGRLVY